MVSPARSSKRRGERRTLPCFSFTPSRPDQRTTAKSIETTKTSGGSQMFWKLVGVNTCEPAALSDHFRPAAMQSCLLGCPSTSAQRKRVTMTLHPFNQRILAEDLVRVRRAD